MCSLPAVRCDAFSPPSLKSGRSIRICTAGFCFLTFPDRRSHACSVEPPHPAEPPNAVTRSRRKYHSGVARIGYSVVKVLEGKYLPLYLSNGQKNRGWPAFLARKNFLFVNFLIIHRKRHRKHSYARITEQYFPFDFLPSTYNGISKKALWTKSRRFEGYIF